MNTTVPEGVELAKNVLAEISGKPSDVMLILGVPFTHITKVGEIISGSGIGLAAQNCADKESGAYTGEVSASMLRSAGCGYVILGHSERRQYYGETEYKTYEVGDTGVLHMLRDTAVKDMCFLGRRMSVVDISRQPFLESWECVVDEETTGQSTSDIKNPHPNTVYTVGGKQYIYYINGQWYEVGEMENDSSSLLAKVPIQGIISYYGNVVRNSY